MEALRCVISRVGWYNGSKFKPGQAIMESPEEIREALRKLTSEDMKPMRGEIELFCYNDTAEMIKDLLLDFDRKIVK